MSIKHIIREVEPEACDFSFYFDDDGLSERGGDYCYTLFIVPTRDTYGFNGEEYKNVQKEAAAIISGFSDVRDGVTDYDGNRYTYKRVMEDEGLSYNSRKCHALKEWATDADEDEPEDIAAFLTITTGKKWDVTSVCGYSQGDYVELVYCPEHYKNGVKN